ncbi:MAG TPA: hypothetical protein VMZ73_01320 [Acidimicrobiales bacterium]|nr:hypothetical protein [Acidimicrobiales bacterium]
MQLVGAPKNSDNRWPRSLDSIADPHRRPIAAFEEMAAELDALLDRFVPLVWRRAGAAQTAGLVVTRHADSADVAGPSR